MVIGQSSKPTPSHKSAIFLTHSIVSSIDRKQGTNYSEHHRNTENVASMLLINCSTNETIECC